MSRSAIIRTVLLLLPLALTWPLGWATMEGYLNFGGGEKDVILLIPWALWSLLYAVIGAVLWKKGRALLPATTWAVGVAAGITFLLVLLLAFGVGFMQRA